MKSDEKAAISDDVVWQSLNYCYDWEVFGTPSGIFERVREYSEVFGSIHSAIQIQHSLTRKNLAGL